MESHGWRLVEGRAAPALSREDGRQFFDDLLPGWYDDWVIFERERLSELRLHFIEALVDELLRARRNTEALDAALRLVAADPARPRSVTTLGRVYEAEGSERRAEHRFLSTADFGALGVDTCRPPVTRR
jgi:DNA-binding SARP family transcriptional activator